MPGCNVERSLISSARKEAIIVLSDDGPFGSRTTRYTLRYCAIKYSNWNLKVPCICESRCASGT